MKQSITNDIRNGRLTDGLVLVRRGQLARNDRRAGAVAVLQNFEQIPALLVLQGAR